LVALIVLAQGCASSSGVRNPSGADVTVMRPDERGFVAGTGIESQDLVGATDKMARGILGAAPILNAKAPPFIVLDPVLNESRFPINKDLFLTRIQTQLTAKSAGKVRMFTRTEMLDLVVVDGRSACIETRNMVTGDIQSVSGHAVVLATGGYGNNFILSTNAMGCNVTAPYRAYKKGAGFANPCYTQIHPTCIPVSGSYQTKLTLMSESLRNDGRVWVPRSADDCGKPANEIPEAERDYYLERKYPSFGNLVPRDIASRAAKQVCDEGRGVGPGGRGVYLDFRDAIARHGRDVIEQRYGNLFEMYQRITDEDPYRVPMRIYPAVHYTMGGLWVDYNLMSTIPGLHVLGEANFSDHGANRLGASALMQGLADGYFILPYTIGDYLARHARGGVEASHPACRDVVNDVRGRMRGLLEAKGITPDKEIVSYCQGGGRAAHGVLVLKLLGYGRARNFDGSYGAYASSDAPIER